MLLDCCTGEAGGSLEAGGSVLELQSAACVGLMALGSHQQSHEVQGGEVPGAGGFSHEHFYWSCTALGLVPLPLLWWLG